MKTRRCNTPDAPVTNMDTADMDKRKVPLSVKVCKRFWPSCQFCKQSVLHPSSLESDWSDKDWAEGHTNTLKQIGETNLLSDWDLPKAQSNPNSKPELDKINRDKFSLEHNNLQEEHIQVPNFLILPPIMHEEEKATTEEKTDYETRYQQEEEKYKL